jgi:hypothetical protein
MAASRRSFVIFAMVAGVSAVILALLTRKPVPSRASFLPPPNPNGYELLLEAASRVRGPKPSQVTNVPVYLQLNSEALQLMREALKRRAELPAKFYTGANSPMADLQAIRGLVETAKLQAIQYQQDAQWDSAGDVYLDIVRLSHRVQRGTMVCVLIGIAIEKQGLDGLNELSSHLTAQKKQALARELAQLGKSAVTLNDVRERELYFVQQHVPLLPAVAHRLPQFKRGMQGIQAKLSKIRDDLEQTHLKLQTP